jgi:hypothetical protein
VVGVALRDPYVVAFRAVGKQPQRPHLADHPGDVAAQVEGRLDAAVAVAQEPDVGHADAGGRRDLLPAAQRRHAARVDGPLVTARVAVGDDAVDDVGTGAYPA